MPSYLVVKNHEKFQHYKDRNPPWIKLYYELLDNYEFACLQDASKLHLIGIWLLASRSEGRVPCDAEWIGKRINATTPVDLGPLIEGGFLELDAQIEPASNLLATCKQSAMPETETETETETEGRGVSAEAHHDEDAVDPSPDPTVVMLAGADWIGETPDEIEAKVRRAYALVPRFDPRDGPLNAEMFVLHWRGKRSKPKDWYKAWLNWIKNAVKFDEVDRGRSRSNGTHAEPARHRSAAMGWLEYGGDVEPADSGAWDGAVIDAAAVPRSSC